MAPPSPSTPLVAIFPEKVELLTSRKPLIYSKTEAARERFRAASSGQCLS
jgi:hypothetical protein